VGLIEDYGCAEAPAVEIAHLHRVASNSTGARPIIVASVDLIQARSPTAPPPAREHLAALGNCLIAGLQELLEGWVAQFSMTPGRPPVPPPQCWSATNPSPPAASRGARASLGMKHMY
jgi:hypothetical protein